MTTTKYDVPASRLAPAGAVNVFAPVVNVPGLVNVCRLVFGAFPLLVYTSIVIPAGIAGRLWMSIAMDVRSYPVGFEPVVNFCPGSPVLEQTSPVGLAA